jgi:hypothetical protein
MITVALNANTLHAPVAGGHRWVFLNWALGLADLGCRVIWLEGVKADVPAAILRTRVSALKNHLARYGFDKSVVLFSRAAPAEPVPCESLDAGLALEAIDGADLLLNIAYEAAPELLRRVRRTAMVDIDPGLTQMWIGEGQLRIPPHDVYFTIGETVGQPNARFPDCGLRWHYTPPPIHLPAWPPAPLNAAAPYTTVTNWWDGWVIYRDENYANRKRDGFEPFLDLPRRTSRPLELAIDLGTNMPDEGATLERHGWRLRDATVVAGTPWDYQDYIRSSFGEFTCVKPSCVRLQNAWISDRTVCYLASGKPAVVQHTGPSRFLPSDSGLWRFTDIDAAAAQLERVASDYDRQCRLARRLAEEYFDARHVVRRVLDVALA